ncbi:MAG: cytidine deaminase [Ilumatobacteraceae bacterium]
MTDASSLIERARRARARAYAPYSGFTMGAAVQTATGAIIDGALIENVSLGLAMCAERVALFTAATAGEKPVALALVSKSTAGEVTWPCGACLQVALELGGPELMVHVATPDGPTSRASLRDLLPRGPRTAASGRAGAAGGEGP